MLESEGLYKLIGYCCEPPVLLNHKTVACNRFPNEMRKGCTGLDVVNGFEAEVVRTSALSCRAGLNCHPSVFEPPQCGLGSGSRSQALAEPLPARKSWWVSSDG